MDQLDIGIGSFFWDQIVDEGLCISVDDGDRRLDLMGNILEEFLLRVLRRRNFQGSSSLFGDISQDPFYGDDRSGVVRDRYVVDAGPFIDHPVLRKCEDTASRTVDRFLEDPPQIPLIFLDLDFFEETVRYEIQMLGIDTDERRNRVTYVFELMASVVV